MQVEIVYSSEVLRLTIGFGALERMYRTWTVIGRSTEVEQ